MHVLADLGILILGHKFGFLCLLPVPLELFVNHALLVLALLLDLIRLVLHLLLNNFPRRYVTITDQ